MTFNGLIRKHIQAEADLTTVFIQSLETEPFGQPKANPTHMPHPKMNLKPLAYEVQHIGKAKAPIDYEIERMLHPYVPNY